MKYSLEPEVAGHLGAKTKIITSEHPPQVLGLHFVFDGWLGDDLLETFPCFIVTGRLKKAIIKSRLSGYEFRNMEIGKSETFVELYPDRELPICHWLVIKGKIEGDDFFLQSDGRLGVTHAALELLNHYQLNNCDIEELNN